MCVERGTIWSPSPRTKVRDVGVAYAKRGIAADERWAWTGIERKRREEYAAKTANKNSFVYMGKTYEKVGNVYKAKAKK